MQNNVKQNSLLGANLTKLTPVYSLLYLDYFKRCMLLYCLVKETRKSNTFIVAHFNFAQKITN